MKITDCNFTSNTDGYIGIIIGTLTSILYHSVCRQAGVILSGCNFLNNKDLRLVIEGNKKCISNIVKIISIQITGTLSNKDLINILDMIVQVHGPILITNNRFHNAIKFDDCDIKFKGSITFSLNTCINIVTILSATALYIKIMEYTDVRIYKNSYHVELIFTYIQLDFVKLNPFCLFQYVTNGSTFSPAHYNIVIKENLDRSLYGLPINLWIHIVPPNKIYSYLQLTSHCKWLHATRLTGYHSKEINKEIIETDLKLYNHNFICYCHENGTSDCTIDKLGPLYPGQTLHVKLSVLHRRNISVLYTETNNPQLPSSTCKIAHKTEVIHLISAECDLVNFTIASESKGECELFLTAQPHLHKYYDAFYVTLFPCPMGFTLQNGICECDPLLLDCTNIYKCNIDESTIHHPGNSWITALSQDQSNKTKYLISQNCPMDYCIPHSSRLNLLNPDAQCQYNRSGILCAQCRNSLSMVFGSSRCKDCSNSASSVLLVTITVICAGILLVISLYLLNLTVTKGTINGIIFYANIISINDSVFLVNDRVYKPLKVFISFANLDLGFEMCFYNGMDSYAKVFLQLIFPCYLIAIASFIIIASRYSSRLLRWTYTRSLPVLATLFLLSYTGLLRVVLMVLFSYSSITKLPSGHRQLVWSINASVSLFGLKFTMLFIICLVLFLLSVPFNAILLFTRCLSQFRIVNYFKPLLDAFQGSYKTKYFYWVGVHIILRSLFFTLYAFPSEVNLVTSTIILILFNICYGCIYPYKIKLVNIQELSLLINLTLMYAVSYQSNDDVFSIITNILIGLAFMQFCAIVVCHFLMYTCQFQVSYLECCKRKADKLLG